LGASTEYSVAYFGFDDIKVMEQFIAKYDKFVVEVEKGRKYNLQVTKALYQTMPAIRQDSGLKDL